MAADTKSYPPSQRRLAQLWARGVTPASTALVGAAVVAAGTTCVLIAWPWLTRGAGEALALALNLAASATHAGEAMTLARTLLLWALAVVGLVGAVAVTVALVVHRLQLAPRGDTGYAPGPSMQSSGTGTPSAAQLAWMLAGAMVALASTLVAARAALGRSATLPVEDPALLMSAARGIGVAMALPLLATLLGFGLLDWLMRASDFARSSWMSRQEMQDELRLTEGPELVRSRRRQVRRGERDA